MASAVIWKSPAASAGGSHEDLEWTAVARRESTVLPGKRSAGSERQLIAQGGPAGSVPPHSTAQKLPAPQQPSVKHTRPDPHCALDVHAIPVQTGATQASAPPTVGTQAQAAPPHVSVAQVLGTLHAPETCAEAGVAEPRTIGAT